MLSYWAGGRISCRHSVATCSLVFDALVTALLPVLPLVMALLPALPLVMALLAVLPLPMLPVMYVHIFELRFSFVFFVHNVLILY